MNQEENSLYELPMRAKAAYKWYVHFSFGFMIALFITAILVLSDDPAKAMENLVFEVSAVVVAYFWLLMLIRKPYLVLTDSHIEYRWLYGHKIVAWADIERVAFHWKANVLFLSIWANEHGARRSVWEWLDCITGRDYSFSIGVSIFPSVDFEKLFLAMNR